MPTFEAQQAAIERRRQLAQQLANQAMLPLQQPNVPGAKISPWEGVAKLVQALSGRIGANQADKQQSALSDAMAQDRQQKIGGMLQPGADLTQGLSDPQTAELAKALLQNNMISGREEAGQKADMAKLLAGQTFTGNQNDLNRQADLAQLGSQQTFTGGQNDLNRGLNEREGAADRASREKIAEMKPPPNTPQPTADIQEYNFYVKQTTDAGGKPISFEEWQKKTANLKNPPPKDEAGSYITVTNKEGQIIGAVNPKTNTYKTTAEMGMPSDAQKNASSPERVKMQANAKSGLDAIGKFRAEIAKPGVLAALAVPGSPTARTARAARNEMVDVLTRLRTGAALNKDEQAFYNSQAPGLIDSLLNDPETIEYKLSIFEKEFKALAGEAPKAANPGEGITLDDIAKEKARRAAAKGK